MDGISKGGCIGAVIGVIVFFVIVAAIGGAFRTEVTYTPAALEQTGDTARFEETMTSHHFLWGLVKGEQPDLPAALSESLRGGEQVAELRIVTKHSWKDYLLTLVTLGIYSPMTVVADVKVTGAR